MRRTACLVVLLAACGGDDAPTSPDAAAPVDPDAALADAAPPDAELPAALTITPEALAFTAPRSIGVEIDVTVAREHFTGIVTVDAIGGLPAGATAPTLTIPDGVDAGTFVVWLDDTVAAVTSTVVLEARGPGGAPTAPASVSITVDPDAPGLDAAWLSLTSPGTAARRGAWIVASSSKFPAVSLNGRNGYAGDATLRWEGLPAGVTAADTPVALSAAGIAVEPELVAGPAPAAGDHVVSAVLSDGALRQALPLDLHVTVPGTSPTLPPGGRTVLSYVEAIGMDVDSIGRPHVFAFRNDAPGALVVARFLATGELDTSYGELGIVSIALPLGPPIDAVMVDDHTIYAVMAGTFDDTGEGFTVVRVVDGELDATWGTGGLVAAAGADAAARPQMLRVRANGTIFVAGATQTKRAAITKLTATGALDAGFGGDGMVVLTDAYRFRAFTFAGDTVVAVGGRAPTSGTSEGFVARFTAAGALDPTFSTDGTHAPFAGTDAGELIDVAEAADGDLVVVGVGDLAHTPGAFVARVDATGAPDAAFGDAGVVALVPPADRAWVSASPTRLRVAATTVTVYGSRGDDLRQEAPFAARFDAATGAVVTGYGEGGLVWGLGASLDQEHVLAIRATATGAWMVSHDASDLYEAISLSFAPNP